MLSEAAELSGGSRLILTGMRPSRRLTQNTHAKLLQELDFHAVTRQFRLRFRDYAAEQAPTPHDAMEAALAHSIKNKAEAAYARSDLLETPNALMGSRARYLPS